MLYCICAVAYVYDVCFIVKAPLSGPQNEHLVYKIAQYILQIFIFLKMSFFQPRRFVRGNTWMRYVVALF